MKKKIILPLALLAALAALAIPALASLHSHEMEPREGNGTVCIICKGTGRSSGGTGPFKCSACNGTGWNGSY